MMKRSMIEGSIKRKESNINELDVYIYDYYMYIDVLLIHNNKQILTYINTYSHLNLKHNIQHFLSSSSPSSLRFLLSLLTIVVTLVCKLPSGVA